MQIANRLAFLIIVFFARSVRENVSDRQREAVQKKENLNKEMYSESLFQ